MSREIIAIVSVRIGLGVLMTGLFAWLRQGIKQGESRLDGRMTALESHIEERRERMAHLEGLLKGMREFVTGRVTAS